MGYFMELLFKPFHCFEGRIDPLEHQCLIAL
jgi:hypothetical protein